MMDEVIYESWVVDECGDTVMKCEWLTDSELDEYLDEHPEYTVKSLPMYM